jgi:hypothetical protein
LARNYLNLESAKLLANTKTLTNVESLLLFDTGIGDAGVKEIMESAAFANLKTLRVT